MLDLLQYVGVGLGMMYATLLAISPKHVILALWISAVSCLILGTWAFILGIWGVTISQFFYVAINVVAVHRWKTHKKEEQ